MSSSVPEVREDGPKMGSRDGHDVYEANIRIKDLPRRTNDLLNAIASVQGKLKWELVRDALIEYAENHKNELVRVS